MKLISITFFVLYVSVGIADQYLHFPRGSNNRLNEQSANRNNGNRLFDSQNNNRGGYNVGEFGATQGFDANNGYATDALNFEYDNDAWRNNNDANGRRQFEEPWLEGSMMKVTWTSQHGCGNPKNNCNMVYQWTCDSHPQDDDVLDAGYATEVANRDDGWQSAAWEANAGYDIMTGLRVQLKNGLNTNTPEDPNNIRNVKGTKENNDGDNEARTESEEWYAFAKQRLRNEYLFTADQNLQGNDQTKTRQNPGGTRRGLEVPEERDYAAWWYPTIWRTEFISSNDVTECISQMASKSATGGGETKTACVPLKTQINSGEGTAAGKTNNELNDLVKHQNRQDCEADDGFWLEQSFNYKMPSCIQAQWSQVNNLGNVQGTPRGGEPQNVNWTLPTVQQMADTGCYVYHSDQGVDYVRAQIRMRYNMTTMDYAPYTTNAECNQDKNNGVQSPVEQNPTIDVGAYMQGLRLALNTAQTGRTFQDRSHVVRIIKRPIDGNPTTAAASTAELVAEGDAAVDVGFQATALGRNVGALGPANAANSGTVAMQPSIYNVNIQGKRGNIVQTFPAVEYDFWPRHIEIPTGACLAFQWTGSNTHNNGNPAGDGQAGDAGEGRGGSDRSNLIQLMNKNSSYPIPLDTEIAEDFFESSKCYETYTGNAISSGLTAASKINLGADASEKNLLAKHAQAYLLSAGFYNGMNKVGTYGGNDADEELDGLLNNTPASMRGITCCPQNVGTFQFMSSRNNNFSNRDQKLTVVVL